MNRDQVERVLGELYSARQAGDLNRLTAIFSDRAMLEIAGASYATPMAIRASGILEIRKWLALLVKSFQLSERTILSMIIEDATAAVHWRCTIRSKITGVAVATELVDVVRLDDDKIASYTEFFVPR